VLNKFDLPYEGFYMSKPDATELFKPEAEWDEGLGKKEQWGLSPTSFPELLIDIKNAFSVDKTTREVACALCQIILTRLNEKLGNSCIDICLIYGLFEGIDILRLQGAAGFQTKSMLDFEKINIWVLISGASRT
jgi:hypothetical protein